MIEDRIRKNTSGGGYRKLIPCLIAVLFAVMISFPAAAYADEGDGFWSDPIGSIASFFGFGDEAETYVAGASNSVADPSTMTSWSNYVANSTEYTGRIWTDKSVSAEESITLTPSNVTVDKADGADFLVSLSALSSASSLTTTSTQPLDIVLVLDVSGSMAYGMDGNRNPGYIYQEIYSADLDRSSSYYIQSGNSYQQVRYDTNRGSWGYGNRQWTSVTPKESADGSGTQFYTRESNSRLTALKNAVNNFIEQTDAENEGLSADQQHRISLVKFASDSGNSIGNDFTNSGYNYSQVVSDFSTNAQTLSSLVDDLSASGATRADYGFAQAQRVLNGTGSTLGGARENAQKVVIFFTDGTPTSYQEFEDTVANPAVSTAKEMKDSGVTVYSIGIFDGASSEVPTSASSDENLFMNAVSSNYPEATAYNNLGARAQDADFYKTAATSDELSQVFDDIFSSISSGTGAPTRIEEGMDASETGYITFTDALGDYMEVKDFNAIVYANTKYAQKTATINGNTTTYTFSGTMTGSEIYPNADIADIVIEVTKSDQANVGDTVTVKIPASNIPLRYFDVQTDENGDTTMSVTEAYPLRAFYSVGLKNGVVDALDNPDATLQAYVDANKTDDGKVSFYSNDYTAEKDTGDTVASFDPATGNSFYYFTADTLLYTDEGQTRAQAPLDSSATYYYGIEYYELAEGQTSGTPEKKTVWIPISGAALAADSSHIASDTSGLYVEAGCPRNARIGEISDNKTSNATNTASVAISPSWAGSSILVALGNNGRTDVELPGTLLVTKNIDVPAGFDASDYADTSFQFKIDVAGANGEYAAAVFNESGTQVGEQFKITFMDGTATHSIKDGETLYVYGLDAGSAYTVTEQNVPAGFTQTGATGNEGTIAAGVVSAASFTNTYSATPASGDFSGVKTIENRDFQSGDSFTFLVDASYEGDAVLTSVPMPENTTLVEGDQNRGTLTIAGKTGNNVALEFGTIEFTAPGTYTYLISENQQVSVAGITASKAYYKVVFEVTDNHDGTLVVVTTSATQISDDAGVQLDEPQSVDATAIDFTNTYSADAISLTLAGTKNYTDNTGSKPLADGMFSFELRPAGDNAADAPMPEGTSGSGADRVYTATNVGANIPFGTIELTQDNVGDTYTYTVNEVVPSGDDAIEGMTYDIRTYTVELTVGQDQSTGAITYSAARTVDGQSADRTVFVNSYKADSVTLSDDTDTALGGTKTLDGRDMAQGESFGFTLAPTAATQQAIDAGYVAIAENGTTASVSGGTDGEPVAFSFGDVTFNRIGTYTFTIEESAPAQDGNGLAYDRHKCTATVTVTDENGQLEASVDYGTYNNRAGNAFVNSYSSTFNYGSAGGLNVSKTLTGRAMAAGEFSFTIAGVDSTTVSADAANAKLADEDKGFSNPNARGSGVADVMNKLSGMTFDQSDAGKTYIYEVAETKGDLGGVTYDETVYTVAIQAIDNGDGTMHALTTVSDGNQHSKTYDSDNLATEGAPVAAFANAYAAQPATEPADGLLQGSKTFVGRDMVDGESFDFTLEGADQATRDALADGAVTIAMTASVSGLKDNVSGTFNFGVATFDKAGTYRFTVKEVIPADAVNPNVNDGNTRYADAGDQQSVAGWQLDGITYSTNVGTIVVVVKDDGNGSLYVDRAVSLVSYMSFTNAYSAEPATFNVDAHWNFEKVLDGRDWKTTDTFRFQITSSADTPMPDAGDPVEGSNARIVSLTSDTATDKTPVGFDFGVVEYTFDDMADATKQADGSRTKTFTYNVTELNTPAIAGMRFSQATYQIVVTVTDDNSGELKVTDFAMTQLADDKGETTETPVGDGDPAVFTNTYVAGNDYIGFTGTKVYTDTTQGGAQLQSGMFKFQLKPTGGNADTAPMPTENTTGTGADRVCVVSNVGGGFAFPNIEFTQADDGQTYTYEVSEVNEGKAGMTYDSTVYKVTVKVTTDISTGDAQIDAGYTIEGLPASGLMTFANTYKPGSGTLSGDDAIHGTKTLDGRSIKQGETFGFTLAPADQNTRDALNSGYITITEGGDSATTVAGDGTTTSADFAFGDMTFTRVTNAAPYKFIVMEVTPADDDSSTEGVQKEGVTYDTHETVVTVTVTDDGNGNLKATATYDNSAATTDADKGETTKAAFTNMYKSKPVVVEDDTDAAFNLTKQLTGRDGNEWLDTDAFEFTLTGENGAPMPADSESGSKTITVSKGDVTAAANGIASIDFGSIEYTTTGTYTYTVTETKGNLGGVTYDGRTVDIKVTVTDNGVGGLVAAVEKANEGATASFVNTYSSTVNYGGVGGLNVTKVLNGRDMTARQFTFAVTSDDEAALAKIGGNAVEMSSAAASAGTAESVTGNPFNGITFNRSDSGTDFVYTIVENETSGNGYTCDTSVYTVTITPHDNGDGTMSVTTSVVDGDGKHSMTVENATADEPQTAVVPFDNAYDAGSVTLGGEADVKINATKTLHNDTLVDGQFSFVVTDVNGNEVATGANDKNGAVAFDGITYTTESLNAAEKDGIATVDRTGDNDVYSFSYTVSEVSPAEGSGVTVNEGSFEVVVKVIDDRKGSLSVEVVYPEGSGGTLEFVNTYGASSGVAIAIAGSKVLKVEDGLNPPDISGKYTFTLKGNAAEDGTPAPMPETPEVKNDAAGNVSFGSIEFTMENVFGTATAVEEPSEDEGVEALTADRTKTFTYEVTESGSVEGVDNDPETTKTIVVTVTDNGDGTIDVDKATTAGMDFSFVNTYGVDPIEESPTGEGGLTVTKIWDKQGGTRELKAGDFSFRMVELGWSPLPRDARSNVVATGTNDDEGNVEMSAIKFTKPGMYTYELAEVVPDGAVLGADGCYELDGVTYMGERYMVTATVTDNGDGTLDVKWLMDDADGNPVDVAQFVNVYNVDSMSVTFGAAKTLEGRAVEAGEFSFELKDADGNVLGTATNDANGSIVFSDAAQTFGNAGEHDFTVSEVLPADDDPATEGIQKDGVTYDETVYAVHVVTADDGKGNLEITELTYNGKAELPVFRNTYVEPAVPEEPAAIPEEPTFAQTNDSTPWTIVLGVAAVALAGIALGAIGLLRARRR